MNHAKSLKATALIGAAALVLSACSPVEEDAPEESTATVENANDTLAAVLGEMEQSETIRQAVEDAGLASLMDGSGVYTLLAPRDSAFEALGESGEGLMSEEQRPLLVGLLREHILPGHVTPEAIETAIDQQNGKVEMTTLGGGTVTFSRDGNAILVSDSGGKSARVAGTAIAASNGTVIPIDGVLVPGSAGSAPQ